MGRAPFLFTLRFKLVAMMLLLSLGLVAALVLLYYQSEKVLYNEFERRTAELSRAIQFGLEEVSGAGPPDEKRLQAYLKRLNPKGVREISIISATDRIVASTDPKNIGKYITQSKKEMIFQAELGQPMKSEGQSYNVTLPVVFQGKQLGYVNLRMGAEDFDLFLQTSMKRRIAAALVVFALGTVVAFWLSGRYTAPVERVVRAAGAVAAGDLTVELPVDRRDEIGALAQSFNAMVGRLREERDLRERLRKAEHLAGIGQFSQSIAHEIRNPLNFISLSIDHLREAHAPADAAAAAEFAALCENMKKEIQRVSRFAQSFLEFGRPLELNRRPVAIGPLIDGVLALRHGQGRPRAGGDRARAGRAAGAGDRPGLHPHLPLQPRAQRLPGDARRAARSRSARGRSAGCSRSSSPTPARGSRRRSWRRSSTRSSRRRPRGSASGSRSSSGSSRSTGGAWASRARRGRAAP